MVMKFQAVKNWVALFKKYVLKKLIQISTIISFLCSCLLIMFPFLLSDMWNLNQFEKSCMRIVDTETTVNNSFINILGKLSITPHFYRRFSTKSYNLQLFIWQNSRFLLVILDYHPRAWSLGNLKGKSINREIYLTF